MLTGDEQQRTPRGGMMSYFTNLIRSDSRRGLARSASKTAAVLPMPDEHDFKPAYMDGDTPDISANTTLETLNEQKEANTSYDELQREERNVYLIMNKQMAMKSGRTCGHLQLKKIVLEPQRAEFQHSGKHHDSDSRLFVRIRDSYGSPYPCVEEQPVSAAASSYSFTFDDTTNLIVLPEFKLVLEVVEVTQSRQSRAGSKTKLNLLKRRMSLSTGSSNGAIKRSDSTASALMPISERASSAPRLGLVGFDTEQTVLARVEITLADIPHKSTRAADLRLEVVRRDHDTPLPFKRMAKLYASLNVETKEQYIAGYVHVQRQRARVQGWNVMYVTVNRDYINIFPGEYSSVPTDQLAVLDVSLPSIVSGVMSGATSRSLTVQVETVTGTRYLFAVDTPQEYVRWETALKEAVQTAQAWNHG